MNIWEIQFELCNPHKRKRQELGTDRDVAHSLYKVIEILHSRIMILEEIIGMSLENAKLIKALGGPIGSLKEMRYLLDDLPSSKNSRILTCPVETCSQSYSRSDRLNTHIRKSKGYEHRIVRDIINQTYCIQCDKFCNQGYLAQHEKKVHGELSDHRMDNFRSLLKMVSCKWDFYYFSLCRQ